MHACICYVGGIRGHGPQRKPLNNVRSKSDICHHHMNRDVLVFTYSREGGYGNERRQGGQTEGTVKERGRKGERNQGTKGIMKQNKEN
jgi:hypothetical protein